jgi:hypothetical protein
MFEITPLNLLKKTDLRLLQYKTELAVRKEYRMYQYFLNVRKDNSLFESKGEGVFLRTTQHTIEAKDGV